MNNRIAIIISSYNQERLVQENIKSIKDNLISSNYKIYFVDDSGNGKIYRTIKKKFPFVRIIVNEQNYGFSKSYNKGIRLAKKEYNPGWFIILNDDCKINEKGWLKKIIGFTNKYPQASIFGCKLIYPDGTIQWGTKNGKNKFFAKRGILEKNNEFSKDSETNEIIGAFMLIKKELFNKLGLFDEKFSPFYGEESDLCFRAKKGGYKIQYLGGISLIHYRNKSINKIPLEKVWFIKKRNSIRLELKHYSLIKVVYYGLIHFGSIFKKDNMEILKKLNMLMEAYKVNLKMKNEK